MASTSYSTRFPTGTLPDCTPRSPCDPAPVCPACGGLECLCRPRFFAGQLLTDNDLNRLDHYITAKNRLHNRYLVGWGVACGLEVVCSVCDPNGSKGTVIVKPGYALSPCGNDIVVCGNVSVNVCDLIARCRPSDDMCLSSPAAAADTDCAEGNDDWILGICYRESASRGVTALLNATDPSACGCGGSSGCGCGGGKKKGTCSCGCQGGGRKSTTARPPASPECEPTMTCEGYSFVVWKAPKEQKPTRTWGAAARRFICCVEPFLVALGQYPSDASADQLSKWYFDLRATVRDFLVSEGLYDCTIAAKLAAATTPDLSQSNDTQLKANVLQATYAILAIAALVVQKCLCAALLPPCPDMSETDCVPIATVTVKRRPCEVLEICNISARKFLITIPAIQYWLSFFTIFQSSGSNGFASLRTLIERICCTDLEAWLRTYTSSAGDVFSSAAGDPPAMTSSRIAAARADQTSSPLAAVLAQAMANPGREVNAATLMLAAMGAHDRKGQPLASDLELANPTEFLLANQVLAPALRALLPTDLAGSALLGALANAGDSSNVDALSQQVADLQKTVAKQQRDINRLSKSRRG